MFKSIVSSPMMEHVWFQTGQTKSDYGDPTSQLKSTITFPLKTNRVWSNLNLLNVARKHWIQNNELLVKQFCCFYMCDPTDSKSVDGMCVLVSAHSKPQADLRSSFNGTHTYNVCLTVSDRDAVWFFFIFLRLVSTLCTCIHVSVCIVTLVLPGAVWRAHTHAHTHRHTHTTGPGTGRQLNRSAWGNLCRPAGGGRHTAGGSRTGENSNTSNGRAL